MDLFVAIVTLLCVFVFIPFSTVMIRRERAAEFEQNRRYAFRRTERDLGLEPWEFGALVDGQDWPVHNEPPDGSFPEDFTWDKFQKTWVLRGKRKAREGGVIMLPKGATYRPFETTAGPAQRPNPYAEALREMKQSLADTEAALDEGP